MQNGKITIGELKCKCGCKEHEKIDHRANLTVLDAVLEIIRERAKKPVIINSGLRCKTHNKKVGGKQASYHLRGMAADIKIKGLTAKRLVQYLAEEISEQRLPKLKLIEYPTFVHVDLRYLIKEGGI